MSPPRDPCPNGWNWLPCGDGSYVGEGGHHLVNARGEDWDQENRRQYREFCFRRDSARTIEEHNMIVVEENRKRLLQEQHRYMIASEHHARLLRERGTLCGCGTDSVDRISQGMRDTSEYYRQQHIAEIQHELDTLWTVRLDPYQQLRDAQER